MQLQKEQKTNKKSNKICQKTLSHILALKICLIAPSSNTDYVVCDYIKETR